MGVVTGAVGGFTGPTGLHDCTIVVDSELIEAKNMVAGACKVDHHIKNVNYGRDYKGDIIADLKLIKEGDPCPKCGAPIKMARGIEVGQVFKLGTKYSDSMHAVFKDENMNEKPLVMGCYGIGVTRTMSAIVEQHHDDNGIIWPVSVAPYHVIVTLVNSKDETQCALAEELHDTLLAKGIEVILDDRDERAGVKFKDADLLGIPVRITVGKKAGERVVEYKLRSEAQSVDKDADQAVADAVEFINANRRG